MNKKILIIIAVLLLLGVGYFLWSKSKATSQTPGSNVATSQGSKASSLKELFTAGVAQTCTFNNEGSTGRVYFTNGKMRGDFETTVDSKATKSHMIVDGSTSYIWMDGEKTGFKMSFDASTLDEAADTDSSPSTGTIDPSANIDYNCGAWIVDSSMFTLPTGVTFQEFTVPSMAPGTGDTPAQGSASQCSYCDNLSGDSKTQCLSALNCN